MDAQICVIIPYTMLMNAGLGDVIIMIIEKNLPPSLMQAETAKHVRAALIAYGRLSGASYPDHPILTHHRLNRTGGGKL